MHGTRTHKSRAVWREVTTAMCWHLVGTPQNTGVMVSESLEVSSRVAWAQSFWPGGVGEEPDNNTKLQTPLWEGRGKGVHQKQACGGRESPTFSDAAPSTISPAARTVGLPVSTAGCEPRGPFHIKGQPSVLFSCQVISKGALISEYGHPWLWCERSA